MTAGGLTGAEEGVALSASIAFECKECSRSQRRSAYEVGDAHRTQVRCLWCALRHLPLVRRSVAVSVVVGTLLVAINQGNVILSGDVPVSLAWKVPLTYAVPYCVATFGSIMHARCRLTGAERV